MGSPCFLSIWQRHPGPRGGFSNHPSCLLAAWRCPSGSLPEPVCYPTVTACELPGHPCGIPEGAALRRPRRRFPLMTLPELFRTFPDERDSALWLAAIRWGAQIWCPACGSKRYLVSGVRSPRHVSQRYRCRDCKGHFSVRKGTVIQKTKISLREWVLAIHLVSIDTESEDVQADPS